MMPALYLHNWNVTPQEAIAIQERMRHLVERSDRLPQIHTVAGVDVHFNKESLVAQAAIAVLSFPDLKLIDKSVAQCTVTYLIFQDYSPSASFPSYSMRWRGCIPHPISSFAMVMVLLIRAVSALPVIWECCWINPPSVWARPFSLGATSNWRVRKEVGFL
jgi:hypothetical protein